MVGLFDEYTAEITKDRVIYRRKLTGRKVKEIYVERGCYHRFVRMDLNPEFAAEIASNQYGKDRMIWFGCYDFLRDYLDITGDSTFRKINTVALPVDSEGRQWVVCALLVRGVVNVAVIRDGTVISLTGLNKAIGINEDNICVKYLNGWVYVTVESKESNETKEISIESGWEHIGRYYIRKFLCVNQGEEGNKVVSFKGKGEIPDLGLNRFELMNGVYTV
jgi:hypothetical protein